MNYPIIDANNPTCNLRANTFKLNSSIIPDSDSPTNEYVFCIELTTN